MYEMSEKIGKMYRKTGIYMLYYICWVQFAHGT